MSKEIDETVDMLKILIRLRASGMDEAADLIVKQFQEIKRLKKEKR